LSILEYNNSIRDLLGVPGPADASFNKDFESFDSGFNRGATLTQGSDAQQFQDATEKVIAQVTSKMGSLLPCNPIPTDAAGQDTCARDFITKFGLRAFRRPVAQDEATDLFNLYKAQMTNGGQFTDAMTAVIAGMLQSPYFLYHWELGSSKPIIEGSLIRFNPFELASRLSYFLWNSTPDDTLLMAAQSGQLSTPDQIAMQAKRLMADPRFKDTVADFHANWLNVGDVVGMNKDASYKNWLPTTAQSMVNETTEFTWRTLFAPNATGKLEDLFTSTTSWVDSNLAAIYGGSVSGTGMQQISLNPAQRSGILTEAAFLASHALSDEDHPVQRGVEILRHVLCQDIQKPTSIQVPTLNPDPTKTTRQNFQMHSTNATCAGCHAIIDPLGFAFESFDAIGQWRTVDPPGSTNAVDTTGSESIKGVNLKFANAVELSKQLSTAAPVHECMSTEWLQYMARRKAGDGDSASIAAGLAAMSGAGNDLRQLLVGLTKTKSFTHRSPSPGEVLQ
jgi:hypothetical protein